MEAHIPDISRVIQLAVAPVFLLTAVATLINTLNGRLGRVVDRRRALEERLANAPEGKARAYREELARLARRVRLVYVAIFGAVLGALLICCVVAVAFVGALVETDLTRTIAVLFILAMLAIIVSLSLFLREVFVAVASGGHSLR